MKNTRFVLLMMGGVFAAIAIVLGWSYFSMWLAGFTWWGLLIAYSPFLAAPIGFAVYKDLRA